MNTDKKARLNLSPIMAACIIALGLVVAAKIDAHRFTSQTASAANTQPFCSPMPPDATIRKQFVSQMNSQLAGETENQLGRKQVYSRTSVDLVQIAVKGNEMYVKYEIHWKPNATDVNGCILTRDEFGHFVSAYNITVGTIQPHLDIQ